MTGMTLDRKAEIKALVCDILELDEADVTDTSLFKEDHGADSLTSIEVVAALEKKYGIVVEQAEMARMVNVAGVCEMVARAAGW
ncbi:acyl carrier protein [Kibdelosporangium lantanae]|uniref:Acyl carrier protein n=1 Tax=Kibdelosporangium lantanae TaxID=1497396 RepID=A0ABW3MMU9_9PSEU